MFANKFKKREVISILIFIFFSNTSHSDTNQYLCEAKHTVGFEYVEKKNDWQIATFNDEKYILSKCSNLDKEQFSTKYCDYKLTKVGDKNPMCGCKDKGPSVICDCTLHDFRFSKHSGRFINVYPMGYWNTGDEKGNTPYIQIGVCTPF